MDRKDRAVQVKSGSLRPPNSAIEKIADKHADALAAFWENLRIGDGHMTGMARKGFVELGQYLPAFNQAGTSTIEDPGIFPNATQGEIATGRKDLDLDADQELGQSPAKPQAQEEQHRSLGR